MGPAIIEGPFQNPVAERRRDRFRAIRWHGIAAGYLVEHGGPGVIVGSPPHGTMRCSHSTPMGPTCEEIAGNPNASLRARYGGSSNPMRQGPPFAPGSV